MTTVQRVTTIRFFPEILSCASRAQPVSEPLMKLALKYSLFALHCVVFAHMFKKMQRQYTLTRREIFWNYFESAPSERSEGTMGVFRILEVSLGCFKVLNNYDPSTDINRSPSLWWKMTWHRPSWPKPKVFTQRLSYLNEPKMIFICRFQQHNYDTAHKPQIGINES